MAPQLHFLQAVSCRSESAIRPLRVANSELVSTSFIQTANLAPTLSDTAPDLGGICPLTDKLLCCCKNASLRSSCAYDLVYLMTIGQWLPSLRHLCQIMIGW